MNGENVWLATRWLFSALQGPCDGRTETRRISAEAEGIRGRSAWLLLYRRLTDSKTNGPQDPDSGWPSSSPFSLKPTLWRVPDRGVGLLSIPSVARPNPWHMPCPRLMPSWEITFWFATSPRKQQNTRVYKEVSASWGGNEDLSQGELPGGIERSLFYPFVLLKLRPPWDPNFPVSLSVICPPQICNLLLF